MTYGDFKDLTRRIAFHKILLDKAFNIAKNPKYDGYQLGLASMVYKFFDKKASGNGIKNEDISNKELAEELHKPIIRKFKKTKAHSSFIYNIWGADLADMQLISKFNKGICFFYALLICIPLKDKKGITITNAFQNILKECNRKPNKTRDKSMKSWLEKCIIQHIMNENLLLLNDLLEP